MQATVQKEWHWTGKTRRHHVVFRHNTITGSQLLTVNGEVLHRVSFKYKLTGTLFFTLDSSLVELYIRTDDFGSISYVLTVDTKEMPSEEARVVSTWKVSLPDGVHEVEFDHKTFDILVAGRKTEAVGDFLEEGSGYSFAIGRSAAEASLVVLPAADKKGPLRTTLTVAGKELAQADGVAAADASPVLTGAPGPAAAAASASGAPSSGGDFGRMELKVGK